MSIGRRLARVLRANADELFGLDPRDVLRHSREALDRARSAASAVTAARRRLDRRLADLKRAGHAHPGQDRLGAVEHAMASAASRRDALHAEENRLGDGISRLQVRTETFRRDGDGEAAASAVWEEISDLDLAVERAEGIVMRLGTPAVEPAPHEPQSVHRRQPHDRAHSR